MAWDGRMIERAAATATYGGAGAAIFFGGLSISEWAALGGLVLALAGLVVRVWYEERRLKAYKLAHPPKRRCDD